MISKKRKLKRLVIRKVWIKYCLPLQLVNIQLISCYRLTQLIENQIAIFDSE